MDQSTGARVAEGKDVADRNEPAFNQLYRDHVAAVFAYARSRTSTEAAWEVVEEVFLVAWRRAEAVTPDEPRAWLLGVARRVLANSRRADKRRGALGDRVVALRSVDCLAPDPADEVTTRDAALAAFDRLAERDREVLALVAWGQLSPEAGAGVLGCSKRAFLMRLHRARRRLEAAIRLEEISSSAAAISLIDPRPSVTSLLSKEFLP
jgi:RNA polymerase sigma-70 factor (ECF subfamily)